MRAQDPREVHRHKQNKKRTICSTFNKYLKLASGCPKFTLFRGFYNSFTNRRIFISFVSNDLPKYCVHISKAISTSGTTLKNAYCLSLEWHLKIIRFLFQQNTRILSSGQENSLFMIKSKLDIAGSFRANYTFYTVYQGNDSRKYFELTWTWPTDRQWASASNTISCLL